MNDLHLYPELELWVLHNNLTDDDHIVTWRQLEDTFPEHLLQSMLNGRDEYWQVWRKV